MLIPRMISPPIYTLFVLFGLVWVLCLAVLRGYSQLRAWELLLVVLYDLTSYIRVSGQIFQTRFLLFKVSYKGLEIVWGKSLTHGGPQFDT